MNCRELTLPSNRGYRECSHQMSSSHPQRRPRHREHRPGRRRDSPAGLSRRWWWRHRRQRRWRRGRQHRRRWRVLRERRDLQRRRRAPAAADTSVTAVATPSSTATMEVPEAADWSATAQRLRRRRHQRRWPQRGHQDHKDWRDSLPDKSGYLFSYEGIRSQPLTDVPGIIAWDLNITDHFAPPSYPTRLLYNPFDTPKTITVKVGEVASDLYDTVAGGFILRGVIGPQKITLSTMRPLSSMRSSMGAAATTCSSAATAPTRSTPTTATIPSTPQHTGDASATKRRLKPPLRPYGRITPWPD